MRICIDLDGVIADFKRPGETYAECRPMPGAAEKIRGLKDAGHTIIIHTARHMKSCGANVGQVTARVGKITLDWLAEHGIPYDEIYFGKPWAQVYIDDNAFRFSDWELIGPAGEGLPASNESLREPRAIAP